MDNLKLGYGGNKTEMERLIADANKLKEANGEAGDLTIEKFSDVAEAIHLVQENMGMAGQAADEAAGTIEGSAASAQAAWENLLVGIADPTADLDKLIDEFVTAKTTEIQNLLPTVENTIEGIGKAIDKLMPELDGAGEELANMMTQDMIPGIIEALKWFIKNYDKAATGIKMIVAAIAIDKTASFVGNLGDLASKLTDVSGGADKALPSLEKFAGFLTSDLSTAATTAKTAITTSAAETAAGIETAAATSTAALLPYIAIIAAVTAAALAAADAIDKMGDKMVEESQYWNGYSDSMNDANDRYAKLSNTSQEEAAEMAKAWVDADKEKLQSTRETLARLERSLSEMEKLSDEEIDWNVYNSLYQQAEQAKRDIQSLENLTHYEEKILNEQAEIEEKAAADAQVRQANYQQHAANYAQASKEAAEKSSEERIQALWDSRDKELEEQEKIWDAQFHWDKKSQDEYWENRRRYLETHKNNSEAWWKAWNETEKYYADKAAKDEKQRQDEAARQQRDEEKKRSDEEKAERERIAKEREDLKEYFSSLEDQKDDKGEKWLLDRQKEYLDTLDESSDLYKEYYRKWKNAKKDFDEKQLAAEKEAATTVIKKFRDIQDTMKKEMSDLTSEGKEAAQKLADEYARGQQSIMDAVNKPEKVTDINGNERLIFTNFAKKKQELEKYRKNLDKLGELGLSEQHLKDIFSMDLDTRMKYIEELLRMTDSNRQSYLRDYENYYAAAGQVSRQEAALSGAEADIMKDSIDTVFTDISDNSFIAGKQAKEQWLKGFTEAGGELGAQYAADLFGQPAPSQSAASDLPQNISINIAGQNVIKTTFLDFLKSLKNSGGVMDV